VSDFEGGFILERTDSGVAPIVYDVARTYLSRHDGGPVGRTLCYATSRGATSMALEVGGGAANGRGSMQWPDVHRALAKDLAVALGCRAWAWGRENQVGSEFVVGYARAGETIAEESAVWDLQEDDAAGPIGRLAHELGSWEAAEGNVWVTQALDVPLDPALLTDYLRAFEVPTPGPSPGVGTLSVFLMQSVLADSAKLAGSMKVDLGAVFAAAWDLSRVELAAVTPNDGGVCVTFAPVSAPLLRSSKKAPALGDGRRATPDLVPMQLPKRVIAEIRELALHADLQYGVVVERAYLLARERLWAAG
jgi:hypothetical protein